MPELFTSRHAAAMASFDRYATLPLLPLIVYHPMSMPLSSYVTRLPIAISP